MIETWISTGWGKIGKPISRCLSFLPIGGWVALLVLVVVGWRIAWGKIQAQRRDEIAIAFGRANLPCSIPQASPDGKRISYVQVSETGMAVFLHDLAKDAKQLIYQKRQEQFGLLMGTWPWSPDGSCFVYNADDLVICAGDTGKELARFSGDGFSGVAQLVWLSPNRFVCANRRGNIRCVQQTPAGKWQVTTKQGRGGGKTLTALSADTIAWQKGNRIWTLNLDSGQAGILFELPAGRLNEFCYSRELGQFLVSSTEDGNDALWQLTVQNAVVTGKNRLAQGTSIHHLAWVGGTNGGFAYLSTNPHQPNQNVLTLGTGRAVEPVKMFDQGNIFNYSVAADGHCLFATGMVSNELAAGIWRYDFTASQQANILPSTDRPSAYAQFVTPLRGTLALAGGRKLNYFVYPPANFDRHGHRKYPLVLGETYYVPMDPVFQNRVEGGLWAASLARCGAYTVIVERPNSWGFELDRWGEHVWAVYQTLIRDQAIDTNNVFLYATSAETWQLSQFERAHPDHGAGLIHFNGTLPDLSLFTISNSAPRILLTAGEFEERVPEFRRYQTNAIQQGLVAEYAIDPDSDHVVLGKKPLAEKNRAITRFVFNE